MSRSTSKSEALYARAKQLMPAGVSSPVRAFKKVGGTPLFMSRGEGAYLIDEDGNRYLDFCLAWGPLILGHAHPAVVESVTRAARDGLAFGTVHRNEQALAELILGGYPGFERVRFVVSGTEAVMTALRLARGKTGRKKVLKFKGCFHGHADSMLAKAGSGLVTLGLADSAGVSEKVTSETVVLALGDEAALEKAFAEYGDELACAIVEPLPANNGLLVQDPAWLKKLRALTQKHGALLVFDEVISGFRYGFHGYGKHAGVQPDLVTLGKIIGGGLPVGAITGPAAILDLLAPLGPVYQAGTMAGNPVALAAGVATLSELKKGAVYAHLEALGQKLDEGAKTLSPKLRVVRFGGAFWPYYETKQPLPKEADEIGGDAVAAYHAAFSGWLDVGVYLPPSGYEVGFLSAAHTAQHIDQLLGALRG